MNNLKQLQKQIKQKKIKLLFYDIETSPILVWTYALGKTHLSQDQIEEDSKITSIAYMFEGDTNPKYLEWDWNGKTGDDSSMLEEFVHIYNSADIIVGQNIDGFDNKVLQWRLNVLNLTPANAQVTIDILKMSRRFFRGSSAKLDYRSKVHGFGGKIRQTMADCIAVAKGDKKISKERIIYNLKDVEDTRKIFWKELPYYPKLPVNFGVVVNQDNTACPQCGSNKIQKRGFTISLKGRKCKYQCQDCGKWWTDSKLYRGE